MNCFIIYLILTFIIEICFCIQLYNEYVKIHPIASFKYWLWYNGHYEEIIGLSIAWSIIIPLWLLGNLFSWLLNKI